MINMGNSLYSIQMNSHLTAVEQAMPKYIPSSDEDGRSALFKAMNYACSEGGKRLRPVLVLEFCRLCSGDVKSAIPFACAVEMIHSYSLAHDDLPCMDDSLLRRGRQSLYAAFGEALALLAGDALLNRAFEVMLCNQPESGLSSDTVLKAASVLACASGALGMVGGQTLDLQSQCKVIDIDTLELLQLGKTAALLSASCEMGCIIAGANNQKQTAAREFGTQLGLSFQIIDDILDSTSTSDKLGKPTGNDRLNGTATYVSLLGLEKARILAEERSRQALFALEIFGEESEGLKKLTFSLLNRNK